MFVQGVIQEVGYESNPGKLTPEIVVNMIIEEPEVVILLT